MLFLVLTFKNTLGMKTLLFAIACTTLLLTSCEDEMDRTGTGGGGGMQDANTITKSSTNLTPKDNGATFVVDTTLKVDE